PDASALAQCIRLLELLEAEQPAEEAPRRVLAAGRCCDLDVVDADDHEKERGPHKAALDPVTSLDFVAALSQRFPRESPTLARRFPVRSGGRAPTSWSLHCRYWKSPRAGPPPFRG